MNQSDKNRAILAETVVHAWKDEAFRDELIANPKSALQAAGMQIAAEKEVIVLINTPYLLHAILPPMAEQEQHMAKIEEAMARVTELPEGAALHIVRETADTLYFVMPASPPAAAIDRLSDDQLESAAGGKTATATHQTVVQTTSVATTAEVATQAVEVQTVATTTTVAAEVEAVVVPCFIS